MRTHQGQSEQGGANHSAKPLWGTWVKGLDRTELRRVLGLAFIQDRLVAPRLVSGLC